MNRHFTFSRTWTRLAIAAALICGIALPIGTAAAQPCDQLFALGSPNDRVRAVIEYDGKLIIGGRFTSMGGGPINHLAFWNGTAWEEFGGGTNGEVEHLTIHNGDLIVSGFFTSIGGVSTSNVARWDGKQWHPFPPPPPSPNPFDIITVTSTVSAGGTLYGYAERSVWVLEWDGEDWTLIGTTVPHLGFGHNIQDAVEFDGDLYIAGDINSVNGVQARGVARWDGETWHPLGAGVTGSGSGVRSLLVYNGELHVSGNLLNSGGASLSNVARWDGNLWHSVGPNPFITSTVSRLGVYAGQLIAAGGPPCPNPNLSRLARWNGLTWDHFGHAHTGLAADITQFDDMLVVVGDGNFDDSCVVFWFWRDCASACCVNGACLTLTSSECAAAGGTFLGVGIGCDEVECEPVTPSCLGDLNFDGVVNVSDLLLLFSQWGVCP